MTYRVSFEKIKQTFKKENIPNRDYKVYVDNLKLVSEDLKRQSIGTTQLRKVYNEILDIYENIDDYQQNNSLYYRLQMLRPKFAYLAARNQNIKKFITFIDDIIQIICKGDIVDTKKFMKFKDMMEAIVAYRKYVGNDN